MTDTFKPDNNIINSSKKKHATFLKIYIKADNFKLNIIPIPIWLAKSTISLIFRVYKFSLRFKHDKDDKFSNEDINEILDLLKKIFKELRKYPPFDIVVVENKDTTISIRTK